MRADRESFDELAHSTARFLALHLEALARWPAIAPEKSAEVATALVEGVDVTVRASLSTFDAALANAGVPAPASRADVGAIAREALAAARDARARAAAARGGVEKRVDELAGTLFAYRETLRHARFPADDPQTAAMGLDRVRAVAARASRGAALLDLALRDWADAALEATGAPPRAPAPADARALLAAAREAVAARAPDAALALARRALATALAAPFDAAAADAERALDAWRAAGAEPPGGSAAIRALAEAIGRARRDAIVAWRLVEATERVAEMAATTPLDGAQRERGRAMLEVRTP